MAVCLSSAWALSYYAHQLSGIRRVAVDGALDTPSGPGEPVNFLLVGSDSSGERDPAAPEDPARSGLYHADSISILRVDPGRREAALLSLPRDLWVSIPGRSGTHKLNAALAYGNPPGDPKVLIQTVRESFHVPVHYFLQVDFAAFRSLVDQLGGVNLWFDRPARDDEVGLYVDQPGCHPVSGTEALAYARSRRYRERGEDGRWVEDPTSDIGRIARQQYFLKQAAKKAIARGARNPVELANLIGIAQQYLTIDTALTPQLILDLVGHFNAFNPEDLQVSQPYTEREVRAGPGGDGQRLLKGPSEPVLDRFRDPEDRTTDRPGTSAPANPGSTGPASPPATAPTTSTSLPPPPDQAAFVPHPPPDVAC